jgi:hypothetical protein
MFWIIFLIFIFGGGTYLLFSNVPKKTFGIYSKPTIFFPLKFSLMKFVISRRQKKAKEAQQYSSKSDKKVDILDGQFGGDIRNIEEMERKQCLPKGHSMAGDCVFFDASNANGWWLTLGMAQRPNNIINLFFILKVPGLGTFVNEELPQTSNVKSIPSETEYLTESGFRVFCIEPMKKWHISFNGFMVPSQSCQPNLKHIGSEIQQETTKKMASSFELIWENHGEYFDFDVECSPEAIARSIAMEPWSKELFEKLKATHQTHYEQFGKLKGIFNVGEFQTPTEIIMTSMRDHTITKYRNWSQIRRYIMIIYHLEDGTCIHTSVISMPETVFTQLQFGYVVTP